MSGESKVYPQGTPEADKLNTLALPILDYLSEIPWGIRVTILINLGVGAALDAGWNSLKIKEYCTETVDAQVAQMTLNKAGAN